MTNAEILERDRIADTISDQKSNDRQEKLTNALSDMATLESRYWNAIAHLLGENCTSYYLLKIISRNWYDEAQMGYELKKAVEEQFDEIV